MLCGQRHQSKEKIMDWMTLIIVPTLVVSFGMALKMLLGFVKHPIAVMVLTVGIRAMSERFPIDGGNGVKKKKQLMVLARKWLGRWFDDEDLSLLIDGLTNQLRDTRKLLGNVESSPTTS